jgi:cytidylate kinase
MGSVVFPAVKLKIFLTASLEARADRRYKQLKEKGLDANLAYLVRELAERDRRDSERAAAPLKPASDSILVDSTEMDIQACLEHVLGLVRQRISCTG